MSPRTMENNPEFKILNLNRHLADAIRFREDSYTCSFGNADRFQAEEYATRRFRARGYSRALLSVSPTNGRALKYYRHHGWRDLGPRPEAPEVHLMEKIL